MFELKKIIFFFTLIFLLSCNEKKKNKGEFVFFISGDSVKVKHYEIHENDLENIFLLIKNQFQRNWIVHHKVDSLNYILDNKTYRAKKIKFIKEFSTNFSFTVRGDLKKLVVAKYDEYEQEFLFIGIKKDLDFIVNNNNIIMDKNEK